MPPEKFAVPFLSLLPACVLDKGIVGAQVHGHGSAADRTAGDKSGGNAHVCLQLHHFPHGFFVVVGFLMTGDGALPQTVIALSVKKPPFVKARLLKLVVHVGGKHEIVFVPYQLQQIVINWFRRGDVAVVPDVSAPVGPLLLWTFKGVKPSRVHIREMILGYKVGKICLEPLAGVCKARGVGKSRARTYDHGVRFPQLICQQLSLRQAIFGRFHSLRP